MQGYANMVSDALIGLLKKETNASASATITNYIKGMLKKAATEADIKILLDTLKKCKDFAEKHNLEKLNQNVGLWAIESKKVINRIYGITPKEDTPAAASISQAVQTVEKEMINVQPQPANMVEQILRSIEVSVNNASVNTNYDQILENLGMLQQRVQSNTVPGVVLSEEQAQSYLKKIDTLYMRIDVDKKLLKDNHLLTP